MKKFYFSLFFIFLLLSCTTPQDNDNLQIKIIENGLQIEISENKHNNLSNSMKGGSINKKEKITNKCDKTITTSISNIQKEIFLYLECDLLCCVGVGPVLCFCKQL